MLLPQIRRTSPTNPGPLIRLCILLTSLKSVGTLNIVALPTKAIRGVAPRIIKGTLLLPYDLRSLSLLFSISPGHISTPTPLLSNSLILLVNPLVHTRAMALLGSESLRGYVQCRILVVPVVVREFLLVELLYVVSFVASESTTTMVVVSCYNSHPSHDPCGPPHPLVPPYKNKLNSSTPPLNHNRAFKHFITTTKLVHIRHHTPSH